MNWLSDITPPGIKKLLRQRDDSNDALWMKCPSCGEMVFQRDLDANLNICPSCDHHMAMDASDRLDQMFDGGSWEKIDLPEVVTDPLKFRDEKKYTDRLKDYRRKTGEQDALIIGKGTIDGVTSIVVVQNFKFMGGSMGMQLGEGMLKAAETAIDAAAPLIVFTASGGARMQEGILSLMQMPRTTVAVQMVKDAGLPYLVVLTNPTTGGVTASFAMLGDVHLAEPGALIGFAGPRVIEQTIREKLPEGFQRAEYLHEKGMVDKVVDRREMKATISALIRVLTKYGAVLHEEPADNVTPLPAVRDVPAPEETPDAQLDKAAE